MVETWIIEPREELFTCTVCASRFERAGAWRIRVWQEVSKVPQSFTFNPSAGVESVTYSHSGVTPPWREIVYQACSLVCAEKAVQNIGPEVAHPHRG